MSDFANLRQSEETRRSFDVTESAETIEPETTGCLKGEEFYETPQSIHRLFEDKLVNNSAHSIVALIYKDEGVKLRETKYGELNQNANQIANLFIDTIRLLPFHPNQDGDYIIGVIGKASDTLITILLAIWKVGAAYMPIDPRFPKSRIKHILKDSKPILVVHDDDFGFMDLLESYNAMQFGDIKRESEGMKNVNIPDERMIEKKNDLEKHTLGKALIAYTSGSTGIMKGVRIGHLTLYHHLISHLLSYPFLENETLSIFKTSISFIDHAAELWCPLLSSKSLIVVPRDVVINPETFIPVLEENRVQRLQLVPSLLRNILSTLRNIEKKRESAIKRETAIIEKQYRWSGKTQRESIKRLPKLLKNLRLWLCSGETLMINLVYEFFDYFPNEGENVLVNIYGSTEIFDCTTYELTSRRQLEKLDKVPLGLPVFNTIVYVLDPDTNEPVEEGETGEICVAGLSLSDGYVNKREENAFTANEESSLEHYSRVYHTGDFGFIKNGMLYFEGRQDSQIKVHGQRVELEEIGSIVAKLEYVADAAALVHRQSQADQTIVAFVAMRRFFDKPLMKSLDVFENDLRDSLIDYMMPKIFVVEKIPHLPNGKVDQQELLQQYEASLPKEEIKVQIDYDLKNITRDKIQVAKTVFETIGIALGGDLHKKLTVESNYYHLGGNSLNTISTVNELRMRGCHITVNNFLKAQNLGEIIKLASSSDETNKKEDIFKVTTNVKFIKEKLSVMEKGECIEMLTQSYAEKYTLDKFISNVTVDDYREVVEMHWEKFFKDGYSFLVKNQDEEVIGVTLADEVSEKPKEFPNNPLRIVLEFINSIEKPPIENRITRNNLHVFMMAASNNLKPHTNIALIDFMETQVIEAAKANGFVGIITTNTNPLTQQLATDVFGYKTIKEWQINEFDDKDGQKPFISAPENVKVAVMYKEL